MLERPDSRKPVGCSACGALSFHRLDCPTFGRKVVAVFISFTIGVGVVVAASLIGQVNFRDMWVIPVLYACLLIMFVSFLVARRRRG